MQCRFSGHTKFHYSIAQHSGAVAWTVARDHVRPEVDPIPALWGLLHDASEAYLVDLPTPIKRGTLLGSVYRDIEGPILQAICKKFGLPFEEPPCVKIEDTRWLLTEKRDLLVSGLSWPRKWTKGFTPHEFDTVESWTPEQARDRFLNDFRILTGK